MKSKASKGADPGISDEAVQAKTGKNWAEWFALLDAADAMKLSHKEIAAYVHDVLHCPPWWSQMVTVGYERVRGLRDKHEAADGYQMSASKTVPVPVESLYQAWDDPRARKRWLPGAKFTVRKATPNKSLRITWGDGVGSVEVLFYAKGPDKSQVSVEHRKLADADAVAQMKAYWGQALERLKEMLSP